MSMILNASSVAMLPITGLQCRQHGWIPGQVVAPRKPLLNGKIMDWLKIPIRIITIEQKIEIWDEHFKLDVYQ